MTEVTPRNSATIAARHAEWLQLRLRGKTYRQIAEIYDVDYTTVHKAVKKRLAESIKEPAEEIRDMELARLDAMYDAVMSVLEGLNYVVSNGRLIYMGDDPLVDNGPVLAAVDRLLKIQERRAKLLGLDSPTKQNVGLEVKYTIEGVDLGSLQ